MGTTYLENIAEVSTGYGHSMARTSNGYVLVWSFGGSPGYVEDGEMETLSGLLERIISIGAGYYDHQLAVSEDGHGWAWGNDNYYGKFGVGDTDQHLEPKQMLCAGSSATLLTKTFEIQGSDPNCAYPLDEITYTIAYDANGQNDSNVVITDYLPIEIDYNSSSPDGNYNEVERTVTWDIGTISPSSSDTFTLTVRVNPSAEPGRIIANYCEMVGDLTYSFAETKTTVCCWNPGVIYVDLARVDGRDTGMSWQDAYVNLQKALSQGR